MPENNQLPAISESGLPVNTKSTEIQTSHPEQIRVEWTLPRTLRFREKFKKFLAQAGIALGLITGASHGAGTKAEGMVEDAFVPIHATLRPNDGEPETQNQETQRNPQNLWGAAKNAFNDALNWSSDTAENIIKESELARKIDQTFMDLENLSKDIAYWGAFLVTFMTLMSLLIKKLTGKKPVDQRVETQLLAIAKAVNQIGEQVHALNNQLPPPPSEENREILLANLKKVRQFLPQANER